VDDGILFDAATVEAATIKSQDEYVGARVKLCAFIGKARIWLQVDVGYGDSITPEPLERAYPGLLDFPQAMLRCYAPETALAEKFEAVVNLGLVNSRMKDYFDFWTIGHQFSFDGTIMADTIRNTFARRSTPVPSSPPIGLSEVFWSDTGKQTAWRLSGKNPSRKIRCSIWKPSARSPLHFSYRPRERQHKENTSPQLGNPAGRGKEAPHESGSHALRASRYRQSARPFRCDMRPMFACGRTAARGLRSARGLPDFSRKAVHQPAHDGTGHPTARAWLSAHSRVASAWPSSGLWPRTIPFTPLDRRASGFCLRGKP
jgi:hypothetical protein